MSDSSAGKQHSIIRRLTIGLALAISVVSIITTILFAAQSMRKGRINLENEADQTIVHLAEILETIGHTIRERVRIKGEIRVLTAQQMITAYLISFLPIGLGMILFLINSDYMGLMFSEPCGWVMVGVGLTIIVVGFLIIRKIVDIDV